MKTHRSGALSLLGAGFVLAGPAVALGQELYGQNLVVNGDAEAGAAATNPSTLVPIPAWSRTGGLNVLAYGTPGGFPGPLSPGPVNRGSNFFIGGPASISFGSQLIDVSSGAADIDAGLVSYQFDAYLGGKGTEEDNAVLSLIFNDAQGESVGTASLNGPSSTQRGGVTGLLLRTRSGLVPGGTRTIQLGLLLTQFTGPYNDGSADNISVVFIRACPPCIADFNMSGGTPDDADVSSFFEAWDRGEPCADANLSGGTPDDADVQFFFDAWGQGGC